MRATNNPVTFRWLGSADGDQPVIAQVLRAFDEMRRDLATQLVGDAGMGAGYDLLDIHWGRLRCLAPGSPVALTALVVSEEAAGLKIEYAASLEPTLPAHDEATNVLVRARGWSVLGEKTLAALETSRRSS